MSFIYLASPYSDPDPAVRHQRYLEALDATAWLLKKSIWVYSPIVHCHNLARTYNLPTDVAFWGTYNKVMLRAAGQLWILVNKATSGSKGVRQEIGYADEFRLPISTLYPTVDGSYIVISKVADLLKYNLIAEEFDSDPQNPES
jgi:Domain of unknown function (DUF1937)